MTPLPVSDQKESKATLPHRARLHVLRRSVIALVATGACATGACATSIEGDMQQGLAADGGTSESSSADGSPIGADATPNNADAGVQTVTLQAGAENTIAPQNSVSCNAGGPDFFHTDNHYYRTYPLASVGVTSDFIVSSVDIGVEEAASAGGSQPVQVSLHTLDGPLQIANLTLLASTSAAVPDQLESIVAVPIEATVPAGSTLVVEVFTPNGQDSQNRFFIGSNGAGEAFPSFLRAPGDCAIEEPTATNALGVDGLIMSIVLNVSGTHTSS